jgi:hypothetical protein
MKTVQRIRDGIQAGIQHQRNVAATRRAWGQAGTFADLGGLTARFLEGSLWGHPGWCGGGPDEETATLVPVLAAANRAGFVTLGSQPGADEVAADGARWQQRAAVAGYVADGDLVDELSRAASKAGLWFVLHYPASGRHTSVGGDDGYRYGEAMAVTIREDQVCTDFGNQLSERDTRFLFGRWCVAQAVDELVDSYQLTLVDPQWAGGDLLWMTMNTALTEHAVARRGTR